MQFYARKVLERHGNLEPDRRGRSACRATRRRTTGLRPCTTARRPRDTRRRIRCRHSLENRDLEAIREGAEVDAVALPPADSLRDEWRMR